MDRLLRVLYGVLIGATLIYVTLPSLVVVVTAFSDKALLMFPPTGFSLKWFERAWTYDDFRKGMVNGLIITAWASCIALAVGTMAAFVIERFEFTGKRTLEAVLLSPLVMERKLVSSPHCFLSGESLSILVVLWTSF